MLRWALACDNLWGVPVRAVVPTGIIQPFVLGNGRRFFFNNAFFLTNRALFAGVAICEIWPMERLVQHRMAQAGGSEPTVPAFRAATVPRTGVISSVQAVVMVMLVFCATSMTRGVGPING